MIDRYDEIYSNRSSHPNYWYNKSSDLHASAGALWFSMSTENEPKVIETLAFGRGFSMGVACWPVYQMVFGMSFELMLKAVIVASCAKPIHTHDLLKLSQAANIHLNEYENNVFSVLTGAIIWNGRYPVPKSKEALEEHYKNASDVLFDEKPIGSLKFKTPNGSLDWERLDPIWCRLSDIFRENYDRNFT